jgi:hypothetical protein
VGATYETRTPGGGDAGSMIRALNPRSAAGARIAIEVLDRTAPPAH